MNELLTKSRVLVVEDEVVVSEDLQQRLRALGFDIAGAADTAAEAIRLAASTRPDVTLMDIMLHGRPEGIDAAEHLYRVLDLPVIFLTAHSDSATLRKAMATDPVGYVVKPFDDSQLRVAIELAPVRHEMERKTRRVVRWMTAAFTSVADPVIATNTRAEILILNPAAERLTGWTQDEAVGKPCGEVLRLINQATRLAIDDPAARALQHGMVIRLDPGAALIRRSGEEIFVNHSAAPIVEETGKILGAVVVLVDTTDQVAHAEALRRRVSDLQAEKEREEMRSADLETFAAGVSHDLRSPLNAIAGFSRLLSERHRDRLDASGKRFLDNVCGGAEEMRQMVEDYLRFLQTSREEEIRFAPVDITGLAESVFAGLLAVPGQKPAKFTCDAMPEAWGDPAMLRQVLVNLLGNALKYSARREQPTVAVGALPGEDQHTYVVRDNGVGLDLAQAAKLFEPFQRFHSAAQFTGTGVGLAIAKRIIERHGGRIWAESRPDAGATFFFTLPAPPPSELKRA